MTINGETYTKVKPIKKAFRKCRLKELKVATIAILGKRKFYIIYNN